MDSLPTQLYLVLYSFRASLLDSLLLLFVVVVLNRNTYLKL